MQGNFRREVLEEGWGVDVKKQKESDHRAGAVYVGEVRFDGGRLTRTGKTGGVQTRGKNWDS